MSAALAAIVERATAKETRSRYRTVDEMVHDLEEVLAIGAARAGEASGEATALQGLPGETGDYAPLRLRRPRRWLVLSALGIGLVAGGIAYLATRTEKGPGGAAIPRAGGFTESSSAAAPRATMTRRATARRIPPPRSSRSTATTPRAGPPRPTATAWRASTRAA